MTPNAIVSGLPRKEIELEKEQPSASPLDIPVRAWIVPDFGFLFPSEEAATRYLENIGSTDKPTPLYDQAELDAAIVAEREACAKICHEAFMELECGSDRSDPQDDREAHLQSTVVKQVRDEIMKRSNA